MSRIPELPCHDADIEFRMVSAHNAPMRITLHWHSEDPFAVIAFIKKRHSVVTWEFALSVLVDALSKSDERVGLGDVQVQVTTDGELWLRLSSPTGCAVFTCDALEVAEFASAVQDLMGQQDPSATADEHLDWFLTELRGGIEP